MTSKEELLAAVHDIADPCEEIRKGFRALAADPATPPDVQQASLDLAQAIDGVFMIAHFILKRDASTKT